MFAFEKDRCKRFFVKTVGSFESLHGEGTVKGKDKWKEGMET